MGVEPQGALTCRSSTLAVWTILAHFVDYYSLFWGPGVISTIDEPQDVFTCQSSTLTVLAESGMFHGHSLFCGPGVISRLTNLTPGAFMCQSSTLKVLVDSAPFHGLLLTVLRSPSDFHD